MTPPDLNTSMISLSNAGFDFDRSPETVVCLQPVQVSGYQTDTVVSLDTSHNYLGKTTKVEVHFFYGYVCTRSRHRC